MAAGSKDRRERAAAARAAAQAGEKRRERAVRIIGALAVVAVVAGIIGVAVYARSTEGSVTGVEVVDPDPSAPVPEGVLGADSEWPFGVPYGTGGENVPVLELWEDFQCPACAALEEANGAGIAELAETGVARLIYRPTAFLDSTTNDASNRTIGAWGCAIDQGFTREFHDAVYVNQPEVEGAGWTDAELIGIAERIGIGGEQLEEFTQCVNDGTYRVWAANATQAFRDEVVPGTPYARIDGVEVDNATLADQAALLAALTAAAGN